MTSQENQFLDEILINIVSNRFPTLLPRFLFILLYPPLILSYPSPGPICTHPFLVPPFPRLQHFLHLPSLYLLSVVPLSVPPRSSIYLPSLSTPTTQSSLSFLCLGLSSFSFSSLWNLNVVTRKLRNNKNKFQQKI